MYLYLRNETGLPMLNYKGQNVKYPVNLKAESPIYEDKISVIKTMAVMCQRNCTVGKRFNFYMPTTSSIHVTPSSAVSDP